MTVKKNEENVYLRGNAVMIDLRCYPGGKRTVCRDPKSGGWPKHGRKAQSIEEGGGWRSAYRAYALTGRTEKEQMTLADAVREFLREEKEGGTRFNTMKAMTTATGILLDIYDADRTVVSEMDPKKLQREFRRRLREGQAPATLAGYRQWLKKFAKWVGVKKLCKGLKCGNLEAPGKGRAWTPSEVERLRRAADCVDRDPKRRQNAHPRWYRLMLELGLATGARAGELFAITHESFTPDLKLVRIEEQLQPVAKEEAEKLKSDSAMRSAPVLQSWLPFHRPGAVGRVLGGTSGRARTRAFTVLKREAGLDEEGVGLHSLRHTYARVLLQERKATLLQLSAALGHSHYGTTERFYLHLCRDQMTDSLAALVTDPKPAVAYVPWSRPQEVVRIGAIPGTFPVPALTATSD